MCKTVGLDCHGQLKSIDVRGMYDKTILYHKISLPHSIWPKESVTTDLLDGAIWSTANINTAILGACKVWCK